MRKTKEYEDKAKRLRHLNAELKNKLKKKNEEIEKEKNIVEKGKEEISAKTSRERHSSRIQ